MSLKNHKVLVVTPTAEPMDYCWGVYWNSIKKLSYDNFDLMIVTNDNSKKYHKLLNKRVSKEKRIPFKVFIEHADRGGNSRVAQANSLNLARNYFLSKDYDYMLIIESDMEVPSDSIQYLLRHKRLVVGSLYHIGYADSNSQPPRPCLFLTRRNDKTGELETYNPKMDEGMDFFGTGLRKVHGCGLGLTLIHRSIVEKFPFRYDLSSPPKHSDVLFYLDLHNAGYDVWVDTNRIIPHHSRDWSRIKDI